MQIGVVCQCYKAEQRRGRWARQPSGFELILKLKFAGIGFEPMTSRL